jgi:hypothetical protein
VGLFVFNYLTPFLFRALTVFTRLIRKAQGQRAQHACSKGLSAAVEAARSGALCRARGCDGWTSGLGFDDVSIIAEHSEMSIFFLDFYSSRISSQISRFLSFEGVPASPIPESVQNKLRCTAT